MLVCAFQFSFFQSSSSEYELDIVPIVEIMGEN